MWDIHSFRELQGKEREFPHLVTMTLADTMTSFLPPITPLLLLPAPERLFGSKAEQGEKGVRMLMLLMRRSVAQPHPAWPECFSLASEDSLEWDLG